MFKLDNLGLGYYRDTVAGTDNADGSLAEGDAFDRAAAQVAKGAAAPATNPPAADVGPAAAPRPDPAVVAATPGVPAAAEAGPKPDVRT